MNLLNVLYVVVNYFIVEVSLFFNNCLLRGNWSRKVDVDGFNVFDLFNFFLLFEVGINIRLKVGELVMLSDKLFRVLLVKV